MSVDRTDRNSAEYGDARTRWGHVLSAWLVCLLLASCLAVASLVGL